MNILLQEVKCPRCRSGWDLTDKETVALGETINCKFGCGSFEATPETVTCCLEDGYGMVQLSLRLPPP